MCRQYCTIAGDIASYPEVSFLGVISLKLDDHHAAAVRETIELYPSHIREIVCKAGIRVVLVGPFQGYREYSPYMRSFEKNIDELETPPAGLFVLPERCLYLRYTAPMVVAHEYGHAVDCALGSDGFLSHHDQRIRRAYCTAKEFVTPYAATSLDEYFAEGCRAMVEINDMRSPWAPVSRAQLKRVDPKLFGILEPMFDGAFLCRRE